MNERWKTQHGEITRGSTPRRPYEGKCVGTLTSGRVANSVYAGLLFWKTRPLPDARHASLRRPVWLRPYTPARAPERRMDRIPVRLCSEESFARPRILREIKYDRPSTIDPVLCRMVSFQEMRLRLLAHLYANERTQNHYTMYWFETGEDWVSGCDNVACPPGSCSINCLTESFDCWKTPYYTAELTVAYSGAPPIRQKTRRKPG